MNCESGYTSFHKERELLLVQPGKLLKLDHIQSPLSRFDFGQEGLRTPQFAGHLCLFQPCFIGYYLTLS